MGLVIWSCKAWRRRDYWLWDATTGELRPSFSLPWTVFPLNVLPPFPCLHNLSHALNYACEPGFPLANSA